MSDPSAPPGEPTPPGRPAPPVPPVALRREHVREHHGDRFVDEYEWLRDREDPQVLAYLEAENAYAEALTAHLEPSRRSIFGEIKTRVQETDVSVPAASGPWWYYGRTEEGKEYGIHARAPLTDRDERPDLDASGPVPGEQILVDGNVLAEGHDFFSLGGLAVSADHARVAYGVDVVGDERFDVTVRDIATEQVLDTAVTGVGCGCELSPDGKWLFYTVLDDAWRPHQVWRHQVGGPAEEDVLVLEEPDERFWVGVGSSRDDRWLLIGLGSRTTSEIHVLESADPTGEFRVVTPRRDGVEYDVEPAADRFLLVHNRDSEDFDLAWAPFIASSDADWRPVASSVAGERFLGVDAFDDFAVLSLRSDGLTALRILPHDTTADSGFGVPQPVPFAEPLHTVGLGDNPEPATTRLQVSYESFVTPRSVYELDVATGGLTLLKQQPVRGGYDPAAYEQHREWATAADGTRIPISVVAPAGASPDAGHPCLLTAYGAYEISSDPYFSIARLSLLERGVVYAVAHVRGGGELGRSWYEEGRYARKVNTFTDFVAAADRVVELGWSAPDRLAAEGGSAGGLLIGAAVNLAPSRFRVVHAAVPFVDALTTILRPDLPLTVGEWDEWGNPLEDPEIYSVMRGYSPYENIAPTAYPAILASTSLNDTRVYFTEPAKWVARLRATVTNDPAARPILLRTEMAAGHGGRSGRYAAWEQVAWEWAFVLDQLGAGDVRPSA